MKLKYVVSLLLLSNGGCKAGQVSLIPGGYQNSNGYAAQKYDGTFYGIRFETNGESRVPVKLSGREAEQVFYRLEEKHQNQASVPKQPYQVSIENFRQNVDFCLNVGLVGLCICTVLYLLAIQTRTILE